jgi:hypothetical protein
VTTAIEPLLELLHDPASPAGRHAGLDVMAARLKDGHVAHAVRPTASSGLRT